MALQILDTPAATGARVDTGPGTCDLILIGGSAGSISVARRILHALPADLGAAVLVVIHQAQISGGGLVDVLASTGLLRPGRVVDGERPRPGHVYVAKPDNHLLVEPDRLRVSHGPRENGFRPAIDALFRTAALSYGPRVVAVLLSGYLDDGTMGLLHVLRGGGTTIVQDPADAEVADMPRSAIRYARPMHVLAGDAIAPLLVSLAGRRPTPPEPDESAGPANPTEVAAPQNGIADGDGDDVGRPDPTTGPVDVRLGINGSDTAEYGDDGLTRGPMPGRSANIHCPQCGGALWEVQEGDLLRFQCHVGHRFSAESMSAAKDAEVETALWAALRALQERAGLYWRMAEKASQANAPTLADRYREHAEEAERRGDAIRRVVLDQA